MASDQGVAPRSIVRSTPWRSCTTSRPPALTPTMRVPSAESSKPPSFLASSVARGLAEATSQSAVPLADVPIRTGRSAAKRTAAVNAGRPSTSLRSAVSQTRVIIAGRWW
jgi:hypothetical protein